MDINDSTIESNLEMLAKVEAIKNKAETLQSDDAAQAKRLYTECTELFQENDVSVYEFMDTNNGDIILDVLHEGVGDVVNSFIEWITSLWTSMLGMFGSSSKKDEDLVEKIDSEYNSSYRNIKKYMKKLDEKGTDYNKVFDTHMCSLYNNIPTLASFEGQIAHCRVHKTIAKTGKQLSRLTNCTNIESLADFIDGANFASLKWVKQSPRGITTQNRSGIQLAYFTSDTFFYLTTNETTSTIERVKATPPISCVSDFSKYDLDAIDELYGSLKGVTLYKYLDDVSYLKKIVSKKVKLASGKRMSKHIKAINKCLKSTKARVEVLEDFVSYITQIESDLKALV